MIYSTWSNIEIDTEAVVSAMPPQLQTIRSGTGVVIPGKEVIYAFYIINHDPLW